MIKRIFLIILDSLGAGEAPDAAKFLDVGCNTLRSLSTSNKLSIETLKSLGIGNIDGLDFLGTTASPEAAVARMTEQSAGKDTTIGHWEIAGLISETPMLTYPDGFPDDVIAEFERQCRRGTLCNKPYSGTQVIRDYGEEHMKTGSLIVYTSADSVFQIAAHEEIVPPEKLYEYCRIARRILTGKNGVGRVIARPFVGTSADNFTRTSNRHDFSLEPSSVTMLDAIKDAGLDAIAVGKIGDIFAHRGMTKSTPIKSNADGMAKTDDEAAADFHGLCFVNLVDFDMLYGHRNDIDGYAAALTRFDGWLKGFIGRMRADDVLMISADHGCDPGDASTDHTREYVPLIVYGDKIIPKNLGTRRTFADIAATVTDMLGVAYKTSGESFSADIVTGKN